MKNPAVIGLFNENTFIRDFYFPMLLKHYVKITNCTHKPFKEKIRMVKKNPVVRIIYLWCQLYLNETEIFKKAIYLRYMTSLLAPSVIHSFFTMASYHPVSPSPPTFHTLGLKKFSLASSRKSS